MGVIRRPSGLTLRLVALGMLGFGCYQVAWTVGLTQISAGESALIVAAAPVFVALLAGALGMDRLTLPKLAGALIAFGGVALVIAGGHELTPGASLMGDALTLLAAIVWAVYTVLGTRMLRRVDPLQATAWSVLGGTILLVPLGLWEVATSPPVVVTLPAIAAVLYSGALAVGASNVLVFNAIRHIGPTRATVSQLLVPAGAVTLGAIFLAEPVGIVQVAGGAIIVLGVWLTRRRMVIPARLRVRLPGADLPAVRPLDACRGLGSQARLASAGSLAHCGASTSMADLTIGDIPATDATVAPRGERRRGGVRAPPGAAPCVDDQGRLRGVRRCRGRKGRHAERVGHRLAATLHAA